MRPCTATLFARRSLDAVLAESGLQLVDPGPVREGQTHVIAIVGSLVLATFNPRVSSTDGTDARGVVVGDRIYRS